MGRPVGICLFVTVLCSVIALTLANVADARVVTLAFTNDSGAPDPLRALAEGGAAQRADRSAPTGPGLAAGVYRVADDGSASGSGGRRLRPDQDNQPRSGPVPQAVGDIAPGLWATAFDTAQCSYELLRVMADHRVASIGQDHLASGRLLAQINGVEPDWFSSTPGCGTWYRWQPLAVALSQAGNGDYWVGDLARGLWRVPEGCRWEKTVGFRGAEVNDVVEFGAGPTALVVDAETYGVRIRGCSRPLTLDVTADPARLGSTTGITTATSAPPPVERPQRRRSTAATDPPSADDPAATQPAATPATTPSPQPAPTSPATTGRNG